MAPAALDALKVPVNANGTSKDVSRGEKPNSNGVNQKASHSPIDDEVHFSGQQVTALEEIVVTSRTKFISDFDHVHEHTFESSSLEDFLDYIEQERLAHMPHRGSKWDKVLKWAEFFALQISAYQRAVEPFVLQSKAAAKLIWTASRILLELGPGNAQALETTFGAFYKFGLSLSFFLRHSQLLKATTGLRKETGEIFKDILTLACDVTIYYHKRIHGISKGPLSLDFNQVFGRNIQSFKERKKHMIDAMWDCQLGDDVSVNIGTLRKWLNPHDRVLRTILNDRRSDLDRREEFTCEWFQKHLLDFSRGKDDMLAVKGPAGSGKSVLYGWILERLQRPVGKKTHETLSLSIQSDMPNKSTTLTIAQNLCLQLLDADVGDKKLFERLVSVYNASTKSKASYDIEQLLWEAVGTGLATYSSSQTAGSLMLIFDGLDEIAGGQASFDAIIKRLEAFSLAHKNVQTIIISRQYSPNKAGVQLVEVTPDRTHDDMEQVLEKALRYHIHFQDQSDFDREAVVEQLVHEAKGSFLWALLTLGLLGKEKTHGGFMKSLKECPKTLDETLHKVVGMLDFSMSDTKSLVNWMLVAQRPFTLPEAKYLLQVNLQQKTLIDRKTDVAEDILHACGSLVVIRRGVVSFRHDAIRSYLLRHQAAKKTGISWKDAQTDLTKRLLAYAKFCLTSSQEPNFEIPDFAYAEDIFHSYPLLEYVLMYWTHHFQSSTMHKSVGPLELSPDFKAIFPSSSQLATIEWIYWEPFTSISQALSMHDLALRVRREVFTEKHESVLQSLIICGSLYKKLGHTTEASDCFYRASRIGQEIFREHSTVTISCTASFLTLTEEVPVTKRTELSAHREEMLKYIIIAYKHQHGETSDTVISSLKTLAQLYIDIHEEHHAETIWRELHEIIIVRHGKGSEEESSASKKLRIVFKKEKKEEDIYGYERSIFETHVTSDLWDARRIKTMFELALSYEAKGEFFLAEELYITFWRRLTEVCHQSHHQYGVEIHISTFDVVLEYIRFLRRRHRDEESSSVLICIWTEYAEYDFDSEIIFLRLKVVGELMRSVGLYSTAVSVFRKCWAWFKSHEKHEHIAPCEVSISETIQEIITTATETITATKTSITTEAVIKNVFETAISRAIITSETTSICKSLISFYMKREQWQEAIEVTNRSLTILWKRILASNGTVALPRRFDREAIDIATQLAICHYRLHHFHEAEEIYVRIYRACRTSCNIDDERLTKAYVTLIIFHEEHRHWHKMIEIYQELLIEYRRHLGASHALTIQTLYVLGALCAEHGHGDAREYYEEIVVALNGNKDICHHDASEAMNILCKIYYEDGLWQKLRETCKALWQTWIHHYHERNFDAEFIEILYKRYIYALEHHGQNDYETVRTITVQYRDTCRTVFGVLSIITVKAMIELAQISLQKEKYIHEAIKIYEEVITNTTTTTTTATTNKTVAISTKTITTVKEHLAKAYVTVCSYGTPSATIIERGIKVLMEQFEHMKVHFGFAHSETLSALHEIIIMYSKLKTQESHAAMVQMLQDSIVQIITKEKHSETLHQAAMNIGSIYSSSELQSHGLEFLREIRVQIVSKTGTSGSHGFKVDKSVGTTCFVFLATLERLLQGSMAISYSEIMTDLLIEYTLNEHYSHCIASEKDVTVIMVHTARLRKFLIAHHRKEQVELITSHTYQLFLKKWGSSMKLNNDRTRILFVGILEEFGDMDNPIDIGTAACISSNNKVLALLKGSKFQEAYEVSLCAFQFIENHRAYHHMKNVGFGFKLSAYMACRKVEGVAIKAIEPELSAHMLDLSRAVIRSVFKACKDSSINFARLQLTELNDLVGLLGQQQNYEDLESLLALLWTSRDIQKSWSTTSASTSALTINLGLRLVQAHFLAGHRAKAIRLAEDIAYNLRRVWGALYSKSLDVSEVLAQLYIEAGHFREAMGLHEDILRLVFEGDDGDDRTCDVMTAARARAHVDLLKRSYQRLGGWDKEASTYIELVDAVLNMAEYKGKPELKGVQSAKSWKTQEKSEEVKDKFVIPSEWEFLSKDTTNGTSATGPKMGVKRATSNWGIELIHQFLHGENERDETMVYGNVAGSRKLGYRDDVGGGLLVKKSREVMV
ncbi:MAG: hypothetical protein M1818_002256 [Claussenomyces sp. TS43310]|nr:MAG: hypothetical protein M1818_002256 [Claussenomyces sp. TS43310]